jgi:hypothetical protein
LQFFEAAGDEKGSFYTSKLNAAVAIFLSNYCAIGAETVA